MWELRADKFRALGLLQSLPLFVIVSYKVQTLRIHLHCDISSHCSLPCEQNDSTG